LRDHARLFDRLARLHREGYTAGQIAGPLNEEGFRGPKAPRGSTAPSGGKPVSRRGLGDGGKVGGLLGEDESWVAGRGRELGVSGGKLRDWAGRGWLRARRVSDHGPWIIWADGRERDRLRTLVAHSRRGMAGHTASMTTPKSKAKK